MARINRSRLDIERMIDERARADAKTKKDLMLFSRKVHRYWRRIAPVGDPSGQRYRDNFGGPLPKHWSQTDDEAGAYRAGIVSRRGKKINGFPSRVIAATDYKSHWIEYGTGGKTPTPEFACRQRTATRFGAMGRVSMRESGVNINPFTKKPRKRGVTGLMLSGTPEGKPARFGRGYTDIPEAGGPIAGEGAA